MMVRELSFKNLPFVPVEEQVIYVEPSYDKKLNDFIQDNYEWLRTTFRSHELDFCYLPLLAEEAISYNAPHLTDRQSKEKAKHVPSLTTYLEGDALDGPVLVFGHDWQTTEDGGHVILQAMPVKTSLFSPARHTFSALAQEIQHLYHSQEIAREEETIEYYPQEKDCIRFSIGPGTLDADDDFDIESKRLIDEIKTRIQSLRNRGVNTLFLHDIIDEGEQISRLRVTKDFRLFLIDYANMEIKMPVLPKSVFILFLRHPEGIRFKELSDYYSELLEIYLKMNPIGGRSKQESSIRDVTDPCSNSINEKCARIREAFVANFDDRLAKNYYVTGKRGEAKRILLDKKMVLWED